MFNSMSIHTSASSFKDPFRLDRLADELAKRESSTVFTSHHSTDLVTEELPALPEHIPLSHEDKYLTAEAFNVEDFLLARSYTSLPDLRTELRQYLAELKEELVKLINNDYEAFISLSTDLRDEGTRMERLKYPLSGMKTAILESKRELQAIQNEIHEKLVQRAQLREEKSLLHLLLKISESVTRLESLLLIAPPDQGAMDSSEVSEPSFLLHPTHSEDDASDDKFRGNRAKHLSRVAAEYTQLLYHVHKARAEKCKFVDEVQWRIDRVHSTLSSDLDQLFAQTVTLLTDPKENRGTELERNKWMGDLSECLRTYDSLGLWRDAEDIIRKEVVRPFVKKTVHPSALATPHSPIVPHTPFQVSGLEPSTSILQTHQIPYTPFTAFIPKHAPSRIPLINLPHAHLLEDADDPLARLYNQLLRFVERDITRIMTMAEKVSIGPSSEFPLEFFFSNSNGGAGPGSREFQIMANVVWDEFGRSIMDEIGGIVFAAGRPSEFRKHYETTQAFIRSLELLAPSKHAVETMRAHPTFLVFERRWQLPVYFQLRWKEIVGSLEDVLSTVRLESITPKDGSFATPQASATWIAISACWSSEIYIPQLSHRFWRLTLQLLSRYKEWMEETLAIVDNTSKPVSHVQQPLNQTNTSRSSTPGPSADAPSTENTAAEDSSLLQYAAVIIDIRIKENNVLRLWQQVISVMLPEDGNDDKQAEVALREGLSGLISFITPLSSKIISILTRRCCDGLLPVRSIPSQFRAMSNKRIPTEPSYFVPTILRPVKHFFAIGTAEGPGMLLKDSCLRSYSTEVFNNVTQRYTSYLTAMKKTEESLKRLNKRKKTPFSLFANSSNVTDESRDEERIRSQMILDVEGFGRDAESLLVDVESNPYFLFLKEVVYASDPE